MVYDALGSAHHSMEFPAVSRLNKNWLEQYSGRARSARRERPSRVRNLHAVTNLDVLQETPFEDPLGLRKGRR